MRVLDQSHRRIVALVVGVAVLASAGIASAQRTWIVDQANGPGADFTDLPAANAAAAPNDIVRVRAGTYSPINVTQPLRILADANTSVLSTFFMPGIVIFGTPAGAEVVVDGFTKAEIVVRQCGGPVLVQNTGSDTVTVSDARAVTFAGCSIGTASLTTTVGAGVTDSSVTFDRCRILGGCGGPRSATGPGLVATRSTIVCSRTTVFGGAPCLFQVPGSPAIRLAQSTVTLTGDGSEAIAPGLAGVPAIDGGGTIVVSPRVALGGAVAPTVSVVGHHVPSLVASAGSVRQARTVDLVVSPGAYYLLAVGYPGTPTPLLGLVGALWLDPTRPIAVFDAGFATASGRVVHRLAAQSNPALIGVRIAWQAAATESGLLTLSNAAGYALTP